MKYLFWILFLHMALTLSAQVVKPTNSLMPDAYTINYGGGLQYGRGTYQFFINPPVPAGVVTTWSWAATGGSPFPLPSSSILNLNTSSGLVSAGNFSAIAGAQTYEINVTATFSGVGAPSPVSKVFTLIKSAATSIPACDVREYALVLDLSGSMNFPVSKWTTLKDATVKYLRTITPLLSGTDKIRVIFFNGTTATVRVTDTFNATWLSTDLGIRNKIFNDAPAAAPSGSTPLGAGLKEAVTNFFSPSGTIRNIVLFTDGMQNMPPMVIGAGLDIIDSAPQINLSDASHIGIRIMAIGVGAGGTFISDLKKISNPDDEYTQADVITSPEMDVFFTKTIPTSLAGCTPRILNYKSGFMNGEGLENVETFKVNRFTDQLIVRVSTYDGRLYNASLYKDGMLVQGSNTAPVDNNTVVLKVPFPYFTQDSLERKDSGDWEVRFEGEKGASYEVVGLVDDDHITTEVSVGAGEDFFAGDKIPVELKVLFAGENLKHLTADAILLRPGEDLGDLAARANVNLDNLTVPEIGTDNGQAKIEYLLTDSNFVKLLEKEGLLKPLVESATGTYSAVFTGNEPGSAKFHQNEPTGTYRVIARCKGDSPVGTLEGWVTKCVFVDFSRPEDIQLNAQGLVFRTDQKNGQIKYGIKVMPVNKFGRRMGPAQSGRIYLLVNGNRVNMIDNLDGSYSAYFPSNTGAFAPVSVAVIDPAHPILVTTVSGLPVAHPFSVSVHGGVTLPFNNLKPTYQGAAYAEVDLAYQLNRQWAFELTAGKYQFKPTYDISGATLFGQYSIPGLINGRFDIHLGAGAGIYKPKNETTAIGYAGKIGVGYYRNSHVSLTADFVYRQLPKPGYSFGTLGVGAHYAF